MKQFIHTDSAPQAIGTYSQAVRVENHVYISGQIPLDPKTMTVVSEDIKDQIHQVFKNLHAIITAAGGTFQDAVKLTVYLTDLANFSFINEIMSEYVNKPYPARVAVEVSALPKGVQVEIDAILVLNARNDL